MAKCCGLFGGNVGYPKLIGISQFFFRALVGGLAPNHDESIYLTETPINFGYPKSVAYKTVVFSTTLWYNIPK